MIGGELGEGKKPVIERPYVDGKARRGASTVGVASRGPQVAAATRCRGESSEKGQSIDPISTTGLY